VRSGVLLHDRKAGTCCCGVDKMTIDDITYRQPLERLVGKTCEFTLMPDAGFLPYRMEVSAVDGCMIELLDYRGSAVWLNLAFVKDIREVK